MHKIQVMLYVLSALYHPLLLNAATQFLVLCVIFDVLVLLVHQLYCYCLAHCCSVVLELI
jgi:hypothetical protein